MATVYALTHIQTPENGVLVDLEFGQSFDASDAVVGQLLPVHAISQAQPVIATTAPSTGATHLYALTHIQTQVGGVETDLYRGNAFTATDAQGAQLVPIGAASTTVPASGSTGTGTTGGGSTTPPTGSTSSAANFSQASNSGLIAALAA